MIRIPQVSFDVAYALGKDESGLHGNTFRYDYWQGVKILWREGAFLIAAALVVFTGIWPFIKNIMVRSGQVAAGRTSSPPPGGGSGGGKDAVRRGGEEQSYFSTHDSTNIAY